MNDHQNGESFSANEQIKVCPSCGASELHTRIENERFTYGDGDRAIELEATVPVRSCSECGYEFYPSEAEDAKHEAVCAYLHVMPPKQVVAVRTTHGMSRPAFAEISGIGEASLGRWERGALIQNLANDKYLYLLQFPDNIRRLKDRERGKRVDDRIPVTIKFPSLTNYAQVMAKANKFELRPRDGGKIKCM